MDNSSGNWILILGILVIIAEMVIYHKYQKRKYSRHMHAHDEAMKKKFSLKSNPPQDEADDQMPIFKSSTPLPLIKKINWAGAWHRFTPHLTKGFWFLFKPLELVLLFLLKVLVNLFIFMTEIKIPKITKHKETLPTTRTIMKNKKYKYAFGIMILIFFLTALSINFDIIKFTPNQNLAKNHKTTEKNYDFKRYNNIENQASTQFMAKDGTRVARAVLSPVKIDTTKKIAAPIKKYQLPKKIPKKIDSLEYTLF